MEEGGYTVTVPALPGYVTEGDTLDEALAMAKDAIALYLDDLATHGEPIPDEPPPAELMARALADATDIIRWCMEELQAAGKPVPTEAPSPQQMIVEVEDVEFIRSPADR